MKPGLTKLEKLGFMVRNSLRKICAEFGKTVTRLVFFLVFIHTTLPKCIGYKFGH